MSEPGDRTESGLSETDICILAGGMGTRIKDALPDTPKILAPINGTPFLDHLLHRLYGYGARRIVLSLGHLANHVLSHLENTAAQRPGDLIVETSVEATPQGTLGALRDVRPKLKSDPVMIMNGDSWIDFDLRDLLTHHVRTRAEICLLCVAVENASRYGKIETTGEGYVRRFMEKQASQSRAGLINAGIYTFSQAALSDLSKTPGASLERDFFENRAPNTLVAKEAGKVDFIDIGTPESLMAAGAVIEKSL